MVYGNARPAFHSLVGSRNTSGDVANQEFRICVPVDAKLPAGYIASALAKGSASSAQKDNLFPVVTFDELSNALSPRFS